MAKDFELLVLFTSTPGFAVDVKMAEMMKRRQPEAEGVFCGSAGDVGAGEDPAPMTNAIDFVVRREFDHQIVSYANGTRWKIFRASASGRTVKSSTRRKAATSRIWTSCRG